MKERTPEDFLKLIRAQRGKFKIYLGMAAGVGKTYRMLQEGHELLRSGVQVVAAVIETHGRAETRKMAEGIPVFPPRKRYYQGKAMEEIDLEGLLTARPEVVLVDELAHTNGPGSRFGKRWQDVEALLEAGIHVISTLNVQHVESLAPEVQRITGVTVQERVPDKLLRDADEVALVDLPAEDLIQRLKSGKVYPGRQAERALEHFFSTTNLGQLREMALRETAFRLEKRLDGLVISGWRTQPTRVAVALSAHPESGKQLLRRTARIADALQAPWYAVYVQLPREASDRIPAPQQTRLLQHFQLAAELGGEVITLQGEDVAKSLLNWASETGITLLVLGKSRLVRWKALFRKDVLRDMIDRSENLTLDLLILGRP